MRGLQGLVSTQIEEKKRDHGQTEGLQAKYFRSMQDLKLELVSFKSKLADENRKIYSGFEQKIQALTGSIQSSSRSGLHNGTGDKSIKSSGRHFNPADAEKLKGSLSAEAQVYEVEAHQDLEEQDQDSLYQQYSNQEQLRETFENQQRQASSHFQEQRQYLAHDLHQNGQQDADQHSPDEDGDLRDIPEQNEGDEDYEMTLDNRYKNGFGKYTEEVQVYSATSDKKSHRYSDQAQSREFLIQD